MTPIEEQVAIVDAMQPGLARLQRFPECGILRDDPDGVLEAVSDFLKHSAARASEPGVRSQKA